MIKVVYNALLASGEFSGVRCTEELLLKEAFRNPDPDILFDALCSKDYLPDFPLPPLPHRLTQINIDGARRWQRIGYEHLMMNRYVASREADILHCPAYIAPWNRRVPTVITVHDIIALDFPSYCSSANRAYFRFALPRSIRNADRIAVVSRKVRDDILRRFPDAAHKTEVIYPGIDDVFREAVFPDKLIEVCRKYRLPEKFILFAGNIEPKKNIARLMDAYEDLIRQTNIEHSLVIAGRFAWKYEDVLRRKAGCDAGRIMFPGYIDRSDLPAVYTLADLFVFPSLYEGFGLPPMEAMLCGVPVIVSNAGALPEITNGNALSADPLSTESIAKAMHLLLNDKILREDLAKKGRLHARKFTWEANWEATKKLYRSLIRRSC